MKYVIREKESGEYVCDDPEDSDWNLWMLIPDIESAKVFSKESAEDFLLNETARLHWVETGVALTDDELREYVDQMFDEKINWTPQGKAEMRPWLGGFEILPVEIRLI